MVQFVDMLTLMWLRADAAQKRSASCSGHCDVRHPVQEPADAAHMCLVPIQRLPVRGADTVDTPFEPGQCSQDVVEAFWLREINVAPGTITVNHRFSFRRRQPVFGLDHPRGVHCGVCAEFSGSFWWIWTILSEGWRRALRASLRTQPGVVHEQRAKPFPK